MKIQLLIIMAITVASASIRADDTKNANDSARDSREPATKKLSIGLMRTYFVQSAGKDSVIGNDEELANAVIRVRDYTSESNSRLKSSFSKWDADSDGAISWFEFRDFYINDLARIKKRPTPARAKLMTKDVPADPGSIEDSHLIKVQGGVVFSAPGPADQYVKMFANEPEIREIAMRADTDRDGIVSAKESVASWDEISAARHERRYGHLPNWNPNASRRKPIRLSEVPTDRLAEMISGNNSVNDKRTNILKEFDRNGDGQLQKPEWNSFIHNIRLERRSRLAGEDNILSPSEQSRWESSDNSLLWAFSFDADHDGVLDASELQEYTSVISNDTSILRTVPPIKDLIDPLD